MLGQTVLVTIDEVTFQLKERHAFRWLEDLGIVKRGTLPKTVL
ncbi:hypothetical protein [Paenibacillus sambharensis]|nr:hypothetical protein [Paenibacillus sambharensis]